MQQDERITVSTDHVVDVNTVYAGFTMREDLEKLTADSVTLNDRDILRSRGSLDRGRCQEKRQCDGGKDPLEHDRVYCGKPMR